MQPLAESSGNFKDAIVGHKHNHVACRVQDRGANLAVLQVTVDFYAQDGVHIPVDIRRDVLPDMTAIDLHTRLPNHDRLVAGANPFNTGTNAFCNMIRARCSLTFTDPGVIPSTSAVSCTSSSSMSRNCTTSR